MPAVPRSETWGPDLRSIRSERPRLAGRGARSLTFGAGLEQAEQLWAAAEVVGPVARPLLLFYGLTQAGRAICAAGIDDRNWRPEEGHGLKFRMTVPSDGKDLELAEVRIEPYREGLAQKVGTALDSPVLTEPCSLASLIAVVDEARSFTQELVSKARPLSVGQYDSFLPSERLRALWLTPVPERFTSRRETIPAGPNNLEHVRIIDPTSAEIDEWLAEYPTLSALGTPAGVLSIEPRIDDLESYLIKLRWQADRVEHPDLEDADWTFVLLDEPRGYDYSNTHGLILPAVGGNDKAHDLLITWWLILYALSMLARYYPKEWTEVLDVDRSKLAVPLEKLIEAARTEIPGLLLYRLQRLKSIQDEEAEEAFD